MATGSILPFWFFVILFLIFIVVIQFTVHFVADIFTDEDEYIRYRRYAQQSTCTSRAVSFRSYPFSGDVHWCSSIQSFDCICFRTFPRSSERIKDMFFDIHPRSYRSSKRDIIEDTHTITDIFDSANIWLGDAVISKFPLMRTCVFDLVICGFVSANGFGDKRQ